MKNSWLCGLSPLTLLLGPIDDSGSGDGKDEFSLHALPVLDLDVNKTALQQDGDGEEKIEKGQ